MKKCKITVMRISRYEDLMAQFENPINHACRRQKAAPSIGKRGLTAQGNLPRRIDAWRQGSDRELSSEDTHPHRTQQVSWLTPPRSRAFSLSQWRTAAPSTITVTGSLGILTRFPILPRP